MTKILDTTENTSPHIEDLRQVGCETVIRYYSNSSWKRVTRKEALALANGGLRLAVVYQNRQNQVADFSSSAGEAAGRAAHDHASGEIQQPTGSAIYFAVDFDATSSDITGAVIPFFEGVKRGLAAAGSGTAGYRVGVYGSGRTCKMVSEAGLADFTWLAQSRGWAGYRDWLDSAKWNLLQGDETTIVGLSCDPDEANPSRPEFGSFIVAPTTGEAVAPATGRFRVTAQSGLHLRSQPSRTADSLRVLPFDTIVSVLSWSGGWASVDVDNDGTADGYSHGDYLQPA